MPPREPELPLDRFAGVDRDRVTHTPVAGTDDARIIAFPARRGPTGSVIVTESVRGGYAAIGPDEHLCAEFSTVEAAIGFARGVARAIGLRTAILVGEAIMPAVEVLERSAGRWCVVASSPESATILSGPRDHDAALAAARRLIDATGWLLIDWRSPESGAA